MKNITRIIIGALVIIAIAFYGGFSYGRGNSPKAFKAGQFANRGVRGGVGNNLIRGEILKKDAESIVISLPSSGSQIIWYATSTEIQKTAKGTAADLAVGQTIMANGTTNSDGSLSANSIQLR